MEENKNQVLNNLVFEGKKRYYKEDLTQRNLHLECTTPHKLEIMGNVIKEHSWGNLLCKTAKYLLELFPEYKDKLLDFKTTWSKAPMFATEQKTNFKKVVEGIYINCNHTALHSCWVLQDLLDFFRIEKGEVNFLIHRPSSVEPKDVKEYIETKAKHDFINYICENYNKTIEDATKILERVYKYLNPLLKPISKSYDNFLLFDDRYIMMNYVLKIKSKMMEDLRFDEKTKNTTFKYFDYLIGFYKT